MTFVVFALPRSRTAWTSAFLSYGAANCTHDEARYFRSMEDVEAFFRQPLAGSVETAAAPWWRFLRGRDVRVATIRRPVEDVVESLMRLPIPFDATLLRKTMTHLDHKLDQIEDRLPNVLSLDFAGLATWPMCANLFEHCLPYQRDEAWFRRMEAINVQCNMPALMRYIEANAPRIARMVATARHHAIASMQPKETDIPGMTIQQERADLFLREGVRLFREHAVAVEEWPDSYLGKNIELMLKLYEIGALQFTTARSNGRMFGYLMAIIGPSLESPEVLTGTHTLFFTSADAPAGLGMKLQRASIAALKARGVSEVTMRAGTRASGSRISTLYRRLGAQPVGEQYLLTMKDAA